MLAWINKCSCEKSSKVNSLSLHGMGISRIKDIVEKYDGIIEITPESEKFTVSILLPLN